MSEQRIKIAMQIYSLALFGDGLPDNNITFGELRAFVAKIVTIDEAKEVERRLTNGQEQ